MTDVSRRGFLAGAGAACATALGPGVTGATERPAVRTGPASHDRGPVDLEAFVDEHLGGELADGSGDGATVSVVHGDDVALAKGYGHAFMSPDEPVDPAETLFRIGSVSKAFTWTAAMQLVDRGAVDPRTDVDEYLTSVSVPGGYEEPVTLAHLATHTPGFEVRVRGDKVARVENVRPLPESVATGKPARVRPPGELAAYTNYAAALAGQLVADVEGTTFGDYVQREVFDPLGMDASTFDPAPEALVPGRESYTDDLDWYSDVAPASGMHASATDVARFLRAHLNDGVVDGERILSADAVAAMHRQWFAPHERFDGMTFGFTERTRGDVRIVRHGGGTAYFRSELLFVPELDLGLFVSVHGDGGGDALSAFREAFLDSYLPEASPEAPPEPGGRPTRAGELTGTYRSVYETDATTYEKLIWAGYSGSVEVSVADDGALVTERGDSRQRWVEVEPRLFRRADGGEWLWFRESDGDVSQLIRERNFVRPYEPVGGHEDLALHAGLAAVSALVLVSGVVGWPLAAGWRRFRDGPSLEPDARRARLVGVAAAAWPVLTVLVGVATMAAAAVLGAPPIQHRTPPGLAVTFLVPLAGALATAWAGVFVGRAWRDGEWGPLARIHYTLVVAASAVLLWVFRYWNLAGFVT